MNSKYFAFIVLACTLAVSSCIAGPSDGQGFEGIISFGGEIYPIEDQIGGGALRKGSPYVPDVIPLKDGRLLLVAGRWKGGRTDFEHFSGAGAYGMTSDDMGKTWSDPFPLKIKGDGYVGGTHISLVRLKSGAIGLIAHARNVNTFYRSEDEGKTWSEGVPLGPRKWDNLAIYIVRNGCATVLKNGRIVAPVCMPPAGPDVPSGHRLDDFGYGFVYYSDDEGQTWQKSKNMLYIPLGKGVRDVDGIVFYGIEGMYYWDEWSLVELKDGRLLGIARTNLGRLFQSISEDQGQSWQLPQPTRLAASSAPCIVKRIPATGDLLIIWDQASDKEVKNMLIRHRLSCAISKDEGKTWQNFKNLESLDDVTKIEPPQIRHYSEMEQKYDTYRQPDDRKRYHRAPGPLRVSYPTLCFLDDKAIITYGYGCKLDTIGYVACKIKVLPIEWFYK